MNIYENCTVCPRKCGVDRTKYAGRCKSTETLKIARAALHYGEEPCISGTKGSGAIFFSGCSLGCVFCQNQSLSKDAYGKEITIQRLSEIFRELEAQGAHNINLVTPTHYAPSICKVLDLYKPKIPIVYNCGGYENEETLDTLKGYIDIYLTDIKYYSSELSIKYSGVSDYFSVAFRSAKKMIEQVGSPVLDNGGIMQKGVIIRHLCLPSCRKDSIAVLREIKKLPQGSFLLSLMSQYTPWGDLSKYPEINRKITTFEYESVIKEAVTLGLTQGYSQEKNSVGKEHTPTFDLTGV